MSCTVDRNDDGEHVGAVRSMTFTCDHVGGCEVSLADIDIQQRGGLMAMGWQCSGGSHLCPEHRTEPLPSTIAAVVDIARERDRQVIVEGFTPESNDRYEPGVLARAAACYALAGFGFTTHAELKKMWPFDAEQWKPTDPRRDLEKAGALIAAEIEHIDRITNTNEEQTSGN